MPVVSVIIPAYNEEKYIYESVHSALDQTFKDIEVIVIDDGSEDNTRKIVESVEDPRLKYFYQKNSSQAVARNNGISKSRGDFLAFLDADDYWESSKIAQQLKAFDNENAGLCHTNIVNVYKDHEETFKSTDKAHDLLLANYISNSSVMVRSSILKEHKIEFREGIQGVEDWDMWLRLHRVCEFKYIDSPLCFYRIHDNNISSNFEKMLAGIVKVLDHCGDKQLFEIQRIQQSRYLHTLRYAHYAISAGNKSLARKYALAAIKMKPLSLRPVWGYLKSFIK